ncbi:MAG: nucleotidyltransferase domain-containing protein [Cetobacterium sp.]
MYLNNLRDLIKNNHLLERYNLKQIGIFGSIARGENGNDIDILIEEEKDYRDLILFKEELEKISKTKVDIVLYKYANPIVLYRAKKEIVYVN